MIKPAGTESWVWARWPKWESSWWHFSEVKGTATLFCLIQFQSYSLLGLQQGANTERKDYRPNTCTVLTGLGHGRPWPPAPRSHPWFSIQKSKAPPNPSQEYQEGFVSTQREKFTMKTHAIPIPKLFSCSLCPLESFLAKRGHGSTLYTFSLLCQGPAVESRHSWAIQNSKHGSNRNTAGQSQYADRCLLETGGQTAALTSQELELHVQSSITMWNSQKMEAPKCQSVNE